MSNRRKKKIIEQTPQEHVCEEYPIEIFGEYTNNLNIFAIDSHIRKMFEGKLRLNCDKTKELEILQDKIENFVGFEMDYYALLDKKKTIEKIIDNRNNEEDRYISETTDLLEKFKPLNVKYCLIRSSKKQKPEILKIENIKTEQRLKVIDEYLSIAKKYMIVNFVRNLKQTYNIVCESCGESINCNEETTCTCGLLLPIMSKLTSFKDLNKSSTNYKQTYYEDLKNFTKALHAFQGIQNKKENLIPKKLFGKLDEYFVEIGRYTGEYYREMEPLISKKKKGTSFQDLILALDKTGYSEQYNNAHLIAKEYWGWKLPDLSEYEEKIIEDYNKVQKKWDDEKDRESSPNVKIRLFLHLRARGILALREDFKFPVTSSCINYYNDRLKPIFESCGLPYENLI